MFIKEISISNFRGIREGKLADLAQVNILAGRNNTGKSTVLEALVVLSRTATNEGTDRLGRDRVGYLHERRVTAGRRDDSDFYYGRDRKNGFAIAVKADGRNIQTQEFSVGPDSPGVPYMPEMREYFLNFLLVDCPTVHDFARIEKKLWREIMDRRWDREIVEVLNDAYDMEMQDIAFFPDASQMGLKFRERTIPVDVMGEGVKHTIAILAVAVGGKDSALLLEEPEAHQHPESLQKMLLALFKMARRNRLQLFITTHSAELILYSLEAAEKEELELKVYHCSLSQNGLFTARGISAPDAKLFAEIGPDLRMLHKYIST